MQAFVLRSAALSLQSVAALLLCGALAACSSFNTASERVAGIVTPYQVEVIQGNFVSREQVAALQPGMSRTQVRDVLGSPLIASMFHADRWDYVFTIRRKGVEQPSKRLTVHFKDGVFDRAEGDEMPSEEEFVKTIDNTRKLKAVPPLAATPAQLEKHRPPVDTTSNTPAAAPDKMYPPLESAKP